MAKPNSDLMPYGFLTVREIDGLGVVGGYLVLNELGRPIEFHCTLPLQPNRAQQILYGTTLKPFLYGQQIGQALLKKSSHRAEVVLTDCFDVLDLRRWVEQPVLLVLPTGTESGSALNLENSDCVNIELSGQRLWTLVEYEQDLRVAQDTWSKNSFNGCLMEPFHRIREAIQEAQSAA